MQKNMDRGTPVCRIIRGTPITWEKCSWHTLNYLRNPVAASLGIGSKIISGSCMDGDKHTFAVSIIFILLKRGISVRFLGPTDRP